MGMFDSFFHPERGYERAQDQLGQYYNQANQFFNQGRMGLSPYNQAGLAAQPALSSTMQRLLNPQAFQNELIAGYQESPYAKDLAERSKQRGLDVASSMGLLGSTPALRAIQAETSNIMNADRQQYMNDIMQKLMAGAGIGQGLYNTGFGAASQLGNMAMGMGQNAMTMGQNMADLEYNKQNAPGSMMGGLLGLGGSLLGGALGGPLGGMLGNAITSRWNLTGSQNQMRDRPFTPRPGGY